MTAIVRCVSLLAAFVVVFTVGPITASAGSGSDGAISNIHSMNSGIVIFSFSGSRDSPPPCATLSHRFAFDASTPPGAAMLSTLLTAYSLGKHITVHGTGACTDRGDTETVSYFYIHG